VGTICPRCGWLTADDPRLPRPRAGRYVLEQPTRRPL
jgi:hypothetical protein